MDLELEPPPQLHNQHSYGTRIRHNITIKPSIRLRHSPDPPPRLNIRKIKPAPPCPQPSSLSSNAISQDIFPGVTLHPDDASSKILTAIAKSFLSVDNKAMTIKDLADMTVSFGYNCQNVSAASQAITTYIRTHLQRCDEQEDHPLLLRHILSGTPSDDDLLPALHSRSGGAHPAEKQKTKDGQERTTNFRKGTTVWYLSRVTGAPCPFGRAGIRLCDYVDHSQPEQPGPSRKERRKYRKKERESTRIASRVGDPVEQQLCGQKRKRGVPRRSSSPSSDSDSSSDESDAEQPPPTKIKLTLRLNPAQVSAAIAAKRASVSSDESDSDVDMSAAGYSDSDEDEDTHTSSAQSEPHQLCLPPYPRRSISIPIYRPSVDFSSYHPYQRSRSPSVPHSVASLPPDSDDEMDNFHGSMTTATRHRRRPEEVDGSISEAFSSDNDGDLDGVSCGTSPGPRSPSAPIHYPRFAALYDEAKVKEEPTDVQSLLDAWEGLDNAVANLPRRYLAQIKSEDPGSDLEGWNWDSLHNERYSSPITSASSPASSSSPPGPVVDIKQEDVESLSIFDPTAPNITAHLFQQYRSSDSFDDMNNAMPSSPLLSPVVSSPLSDPDVTSLFQTPESPTVSYSHRRDSDLTLTTGLQRRDQATIRPRAKTVSSGTAMGSFMDVTNQPSRSEPSSALDSQCAATAFPPTLTTLLQNLSVDVDLPLAPPVSLVPECVSPRHIDIRQLGATSEGCAENNIVVKTCQPCDPDIWATQVEGISVFQTKLGPALLLRRIDTDFVNLTTILTQLESPVPVPNTISNAFQVNKGSDIIQGLWVPLSAAQTYIRDHPTCAVKGLNVFLDDKLAERFPTALQDFVASNRKEGRLVGQFGKSFGSMVQARDLAAASSPSLLSPNWDPPPQLNLPNRNFTGFHLLTPPPLDDLPAAPLSPTEQEMFQALCVNLEWEKENATPRATGSFTQARFPRSPSTPKRSASLDAYSMDMDDEPLTPVEDSPDQEHVAIVSKSHLKPLRRSVRVAHATAAAKTRTTKRKKQAVPVL